MSDRTHVSMGAFANEGVDVWFSSAYGNVHVCFLGTGLSITLPVSDARRLMDSLAQALDAAVTTEMPIVPTESGMTELDLARLQAKVVSDR